MSKIIVLQGVPASGKSTWARTIATHDHSYVIVNRDSIREARGEYWITEQEDYISDIELFEVEAAIKHGLNVIIDAVNLNPKTIQKWKNIAEKTGSEIEFKEFRISYKDAVERDSKRPRPVGEPVIRNFFTKYYPNEPLARKNCVIDNRKIIDYDHTKADAIIIDIDGTIALNRNGRSFYDYDKVGGDMFDPRMKRLLALMSSHMDENTHIIFMTGREDTDECRTITRNWLQAHLEDFPDWQLLMREKDDKRHDDITKKDLYDKYVAPQYNVLCVFEDRDRVVKMWRDMGILCLQVWGGNY